MQDYSVLHFCCSVWLSANSVKVLCDQWALSFDLHPCTRILRKPQVLEYELEFGSGTFNLDVVEAVLVLLGVGIEGDSWESIYTSIVDSLAEKAVKQERTQVEHEPNIFGIPEIQGEKDSESEFPHASGPSDPGDMFHTAVMKRKDEQIRVLKLEIQQYRKTIRRLTQKNRRNNAKWIPVKHTQREGFAQRRKPDQYHAGTGELRGRLSNHGAVTLAIGTAASGTAAYRQGIAANTDVSGQTISRWQSLFQVQVHKYGSYANGCCSKVWSVGYCCFSVGVFCFSVGMFCASDGCVNCCWLAGAILMTPDRGKA